jgi:hypothetical protein
MSQTPDTPSEGKLPATGAEPKPTGQSAGVRYLYTYSYIFENPNWMMTILYGFLCFLSSQIIPMVGQLLFMGYLFDVTESLHRHPGRPYPSFEPNKFGYYLQRSLWPFLVSLIFAIPIFLLVGVICAIELGLLIAAMNTVDKDTAPLVLLAGIFVLFATFMFLITLLYVPVTPFFIRAGLAQDFKEAFNFRWAMDFMKKVWLELVLFELFFAVTGLPLVFFGYSCCVVGVFAVLAIVFLSSASMYAQLYDLYLARGGEPIPLKDPPPQFAPLKA